MDEYEIKKLYNDIKTNHKKWLSFAKKTKEIMSMFKDGEVLRTNLNSKVLEDISSLLDKLSYEIGHVKSDIDDFEKKVDRAYVTERLIERRNDD